MVTIGSYSYKIEEITIMRSIYLSVCCADGSTIKVVAEDGELHLFHSLLTADVTTLLNYAHRSNFSVLLSKLLEHPNV